MIFKERQMEDNIDTHLRLCHEMGMDLISLPVGEARFSPWDYRIFSPADIQNVAHSDLFVVAVLSGPFQRLVDQRGLSTTLANMAMDTDKLKECLRDEAK
jgi:hypothetical protein